MTNRAALVAQLAALLADGRSAPLTDRLAVAARQLLQVDGLSLTLQAASRNRVTLAVTDQIAAELEQLQDVLSQGPCWSADQTGEPQRADLSEVDDERWPQFQAAARTAVGPRSVFALPMQPGRQVLGVISAHLANGTDLPTGLEDALFLADTIGAALLTDPQQHHPYGQAGSWNQPDPGASGHRDAHRPATPSCRRCVGHPAGPRLRPQHEFGGHRRSGHRPLTVLRPRCPLNTAANLRQRAGCPGPSK